MYLTATRLLPPMPKHELESLLDALEAHGWTTQLSDHDPSVDAAREIGELVEAIRGRAGRAVG